MNRKETPTLPKFYIRENGIVAYIRIHILEDKFFFFEVYPKTAFEAGIRDNNGVEEKNSYIALVERAAYVPGE